MTLAALAAMPSTTTTLWPVRPLMALWIAMPV
jgi:hypothetical protein